MKAGELMINDWVRHNGVPNKVYYIVVGDETEIIPLYNPKTNEYGSASACNIEPIPLTSDVLVKNGYHVIQDKGKTEYSYPTTEMPDICYSDYLMGFYYMFSGRITGLRINHVHELQHLLRLWGASKEIEL